MFRRIKNKPLRYTVITTYSIIILLCAIQLNFLWLFGYSPTIQDIKMPNMHISSEVYTADGKLIGKYYKENRSPVLFSEISPSVINALETQYGFTNLFNLKGGILAWAKEIDPTIPSY